MQSLTNVCEFGHHPISCFELKWLECLPDLKDFIWRKRNEVRDTPQKLVRNRILPLARIRILSRSDCENGVCHEQGWDFRIWECRVQHHTSIEMAAADRSGQTREDFGVWIPQQLQGCGGNVFPVGPD